MVHTVFLLQLGSQIILKTGNWVLGEGAGLNEMAFLKFRHRIKYFHGTSTLSRPIRIIVRSAM